MRHFKFPKKILLVGLLLLLSAAINVGTARPSYIVDLALGLAQATYGTANHPVIIDVPENYVDNKTAQTSLMYGLFAGVQLPLKNNLSLETGLSVDQLGDMKINGVGTQQQLANFSYQYKVASLTALWESRLFYAIHNNADQVRFSPFLIAAVGLANNNAHNYQASYDSQTFASPGFTNHNETHFAYAIGLGLQYALNIRWAVALSYRYQNLGHASLGNISDSTATPLSAGTLKNNVALLDLQYRI